jgi:hypothetical protein
MSERVLDYKSPGGGRRRWTLFHAWALPLAVLPGAAGSMIWYGDEYGALVGANLPAIGLVILLPARLRDWIVNFGHAHLLIVLNTVLLMCCVGLFLDWLRVRRWLYLLVPPIFLAMVLSRGFAPGHIPALKDTSYREWDPDSLCVAWCWSVYALAACVLPPVMFVRVFVRLRRLIGRRSEVV